MPINYDEIMSMTSENVEISYSDKDSILYSLGVGLGNDPMNLAELKYVYENSQVALPSMATNFQYHSPLLLKANINFILVVHGEQKLSFTNPLPSVESANILSLSFHRVFTAPDSTPIWLISSA